MDALQLVTNTTSATGGVDLHLTANHYSDDSDTPAWTDEQSRPDGTIAWASSWTRNVNGSSTNLHGDIVSTMASTTNGIETLNARFRHATRRRGHFPDEH